jgi:hypothetical protein
MKKPSVETGQRFGRWTAQRVLKGTHGRRVRVRCLCDCGTRGVPSLQALVERRSVSCGCAKFKHGAKTGEHLTPEYRAWFALRHRCENHPIYLRKGITVCRRWKHSFRNFISDMGMRPGVGFSIDRVNNDAGYSPKNCRWATKAQQARNSDNATLYTLNGKRYCLIELSELSGIRYECLKQRLKRGWTVRQACTTPMLATKKEQHRHKRSNVNLHFRGRSQCVSAWAEELGIKTCTLFCRLYKGWSVERALTQELRGR